MKELRDRLNALRRPHLDRLFETRLAALPESIRAEVKEALRTPAGKRNPRQKDLARKYEAPLKVKPEEVAASFNPAEREAVKALEKRITATESSRRKPGKIQALFDVGTPPRTHLLIRGSEQSPGPEVRPGFLRVLCRSDGQAVVASPPPHDGTTGRRLALRAG